MLLDMFPEGKQQAVQSTLERRGIWESRGCSRAQELAGCRAPKALAAARRNRGQHPQYQGRGHQLQLRGRCDEGKCAYGRRPGELVKRQREERKRHGEERDVQRSGWRDEVLPLRREGHIKSNCPHKVIDDKKKRD